MGRSSIRRTETDLPAAGGARSLGFVIGNLDALFEAIEREQDLRGNL